MVDAPKNKIPSRPISPLRAPEIPVATPSQRHADVSRIQELSETCQRCQNSRMFVAAS